MGSILGADIINLPVKTSPTVLTIPGDNLIAVGGRQFALRNPVLDTGTVGIGGLDVGPMAVRTTYNIFAVVSGGVVGLVASSSAAPVGFLVYKKIASFFSDDNPNIHYILQLNELNKVVFGASGSVAGGGAWTSDEYGNTNVSALMGPGLWKLFGSVQSGNTGAGQQQVFQQLLFADEDGDNTTSQPVGTELATYLVGGLSRSFVFGQVVSPTVFNSQGVTGEILLNIPGFFRCYATGRQQCLNPVSAVMAVSLNATRIGPVI